METIGAINYDDVVKADDFALMVKKQQLLKGVKDHWSWDDTHARELYVGTYPYYCHLKGVTCAKLMI